MAQTDATIGYFTVVQDDRTGWTGGLLLLNGGGRPLEFQCTLPVRPSRAHEILFGSTLRDHLIGEVIGPLLVNKCRTPISLLCCDQIESLKITESTSSTSPIAWIGCEADMNAADDDCLIGAGEVELAGTILRVPMEQVAAVQAVADKLSGLPDALEPFERIREAIKEAQSQIARARGQMDPNQNEANPDVASANDEVRKAA